MIDYLVVVRTPKMDWHRWMGLAPRMTRCHGVFGSNGAGHRVLMLRVGKSLNRRPQSNVKTACIKGGGQLGEGQRKRDRRTANSE